MKFNIVNKPKASGTVLYCAEEYSFDTFGSEFSNTTILVNDINLGINIDTTQIVQLWGYSPKDRWEIMSCPLPPYFEGNISVSELSNPLLPTRLNRDRVWKEYYNPICGWLCLDSENFRFSQAKCICFLNNALALIEAQNLLALWLKV